MLYIVLLGECVAGPYTTPVDATLRCKALDDARVVQCQVNADAAIL